MYYIPNNLDSGVARNAVNVHTTPLKSGGRTRKLRIGRRGHLKNWSNQQPGYHERTNMMKHCGKKCFLGPRKTFPICTRKTCKKNRKGVYAAYIRAREYSKIKGTQKYRRISGKARKMLKKLY
jgi:hypothetical protein